MRVLLNAVSAKTGGAANYIKTLARFLPSSAPDDEFIFLVPAVQGQAISGPNIRVITTEIGAASLPRRIWYDQVTVRRLLRRAGADVLFSTANFAMFAPPCRQVLLVRNSLYFLDAYLREIVPRKRWRERLEVKLRRWLTCASVRAADMVITPTQAMMDDVRRSVRIPDCKAAVNHYGVDTDRYNAARRRPKPQGDPARLLFSSLYAEHKNFATLARALALLTDRGIDWRLTTPAQPSLPEYGWTTTAREDARLASDPRVRDRIHYTGILRSEDMPSLYEDADILVYPSTIESFGHPLVEAMAAGTVVVAADTPLNRELAGDAGIYFRPYDPADFADAIARAIEGAELRTRLAQRGLARAQTFTWSEHVSRLLAAMRDEPARHPAVAGVEAAP